MAPPPAKRQKRLIVLSSDDEDGDAEKNEVLVVEDGRSFERSPTLSATSHRGATASSRLSNRSRANLTVRNKAPPSTASPITTPKPSPKKLRKKGKTGQEEPKSKSLYTFFTTATQTQRSRVGSEHGTPELEEEDYIEDESLDEELRRLTGPCSESNGVLDRRKTKRLSPQHSGHQQSGGAFASASQKFLRSSSRKKSDNGRDGVEAAAAEEDRRPWAEKYAPTNLDELAVHKRKVTDVRAWLDNVLHGRDRKVFASFHLVYGIGLTDLVEVAHSQRPVWDRQDHHDNSIISRYGLWDQ